MSDENSETSTPNSKESRLTRRNAKAALTRAGKVLIHRIETKRSILELNESLAKVLLAYVDLVEKHERYTQHIEDDKEFDTEEAWLGECQQNAFVRK